MSQAGWERSSHWHQLLPSHPALRHPVCFVRLPYRPGQARPGPGQARNPGAALLRAPPHCQASLRQVVFPAYYFPLPCQARQPQAGALRVRSRSVACPLLPQGRAVPLASLCMHTSPHPSPDFCHSVRAHVKCTSNSATTDSALWCNDRHFCPMHCIVAVAQAEAARKP